MMKTRSTQSHRTIVVKAGGTAGVDLAALCADAAAYLRSGGRLIVVHGGSAEANALGEALDYPPRFVTSPSGHTSRYTDLRTLEIFTMAVNGKLNTDLVSQLQSRGVNALGLSGLDGKLMVARRKPAIRIVENGKQKVLRDDHTGTIQEVNRGLLEMLLDNGFTPVIAPLAVGQEGEALNVDADRAAAQVAGAVRADVLLLLTAVPGLMRNYPDESTLIRTLSANDLKTALEFAQDRMKKKILGAQEAIERGVQQVIIGDGRGSKPIKLALEGAGTVITR